MIELPITPEMVAIATEKSRQMGRLNNSITGGEGSVAGFVGELLVCQATGAVPANTYEHDLMLKKLRLEVKTKRVNSKPLPTYTSEVSARNLRQKANFYVFVRVMNDLSVGWVLGCIDRVGFFDEAYFREKGDMDGSFEYPASCFSISLDKLKPLEELHVASTIIPAIEGYYGCTTR